jgi:hypothetical protein
MYMQRTLRESVISSDDSTRWLADRARVEYRDVDRGERCFVAGAGGEGPGLGDSSGCACSVCRGGVLGAGVPSTRRFICLLRRFAFLPPNIMLPRLEKDICASEERSSKLPVGMYVSRPEKLASSSHVAPLSSECRCDARLWEPDGRSSCTTIAGRLGVLRRLLGEGGSLLVVPFGGARAESLRSSSTLSSVRFRENARGPGEVRGRRTLLSHDRDAGPLVDEMLCTFDGTGDNGVDVSDVSTAAWPEAFTASSLIM